MVNMELAVAQFDAILLHTHNLLLTDVFMPRGLW